MDVVSCSLHENSCTMSYYFSKILSLPFVEAVERTRNVLADHGFGIITEIDMQATMKKKLDKDMSCYTILGACSPGFAWEAMQAEPTIGLMLPCNVIVRVVENGTEVAAVDPIASMQAIENHQLGETAKAVQAQMQQVIDEL